MSELYRMALITGAASGLGRALALTLARQGYAVAGIDRNAEGLATLQQEIRDLGRPCETRGADVTNADELQQRIAELEAALGSTDLLIASAGIGMETSALDYRAADMNSVLVVNLLGVSNSIAAVLPGMLRRRRGHLVAISSLASFRGLPRMLGYCASKAGVNAIMEGLRVEVGIHGIKTTTVCPGWIRTPMTANIASNFPHIMEVDFAAQRIVRAIHAGRHFVAFPRGTVLFLRSLNWLPSFIRDPMLRRMASSLRPK